MEASHAHSLKVVNLAQQLRLIKFVVPCPERAPSVLRGWVFKQLGAKRSCTLWVAQWVDWPFWGIIGALTGLLLESRTYE